MKLKELATLAIVASGIIMNGNVVAKRLYIGDASDKSALPAASVMNGEGHLLGITNNDGYFELEDSQSYPIRISYLGYKEKEVASAGDSVFLDSYIINLPEVTINRDKTGVRLLCLGTENVSIARGKDSVIIQNKYILQYVLPFGEKPKGFKESTTPKILDSKLRTLTIADGKRTESETPDFIFPTLIDMEQMSADNLGYPAILDSLENVSVDITYNNSTYNKGIKLHFKRRGDEVSRYLDAMEGRTEPIKSPGFINFLGMSFDITRLDYSHRYSYNPSGINLALDFMGLSVAESMIFKGKLLKKLFKTNENVKGDAIIEILPLEYQLITTEESKELKKHPGDYKLSDYGY